MQFCLLANSSYVVILWFLIVLRMGWIQCHCQSFHPCRSRFHHAMLTRFCGSLAVSLNRSFYDFNSRFTSKVRGHNFLWHNYGSRAREGGRFSQYEYIAPIARTQSLITNAPQGVTRTRYDEIANESKLHGSTTFENAKLWRNYTCKTS